MMVQPVPFILLVAALLINILCYCSAENVYCVTPTATSCSSYPHSSANCSTLSEYAQEAELYFTSNITIVFLPGDHVLDRTITVDNVARLTMRGESSSDNIATVVRNGSVGFSFINTVDFNIYSLVFTSYNRTLSYGSQPASNSALFLKSTRNAKLVNCSFHDNLGTALTVHNTNVILAENNEFIHNQCVCGSFTDSEANVCGIAALNSNLTFIGTTSFLENDQTDSYPTYSYYTQTTFSSSYCSGAIWASGSSLHFNGTNSFINNSVKNAHRCGGAIYAKNNSSLTFNGTSNFTHNSAKYSGGAITTMYNVTVAFHGRNNFINNSGNAIYTSHNTVINFTGISNFIGNHVYYGTIQALRNVALTFNGTNNFINNSASSHVGAIYASTNISLSFTGTSNFTGNSALQGGAIIAINNSTLTFNGAHSFTSNGHTTNHFNGVSRGGAMYLAIGSLFFILLNTTMCWENNHANLGGAIYVSDANPSIYCTLFIPKEKCFFQLSRPDQNLSDSQLVFKNNSADIAGSVLYGGAIDKCKLNGVNTYSSREVFDMLIINSDPDNSTTSNISSDPIMVYPCENNLSDCSRSQYSVPYMVCRVYPGETFQISVVTVGQRSGTVSSIVRSTVTTDKTKSHLLDYQYLQRTNNTCAKLNYTVFSLSEYVHIGLYPEGSPCYYNGKQLYVFAIKLNQTCPPGFNISEPERSCLCEQRLTHYTNHCNITNGVGQITRDSGQEFWVGYDISSRELILHSHCPFDYCVNDAVVFSLDSTESTDVQCAYNRSGLLCGHCKEGYSLVLGTHQCRKCTNSHLALLIPFALMGVALVFLLLVCKLTVATGTLNGLVFYANIVGFNRTIFLPMKSTDALSVFIAWLNLDFGIETCFYSGMDTSSKTWLQFVFPVYIWLLVGITIFISHYSQRFASLLGNNPVSVLATLILLSYTKVLRTLIAVSSFTHLDYPDDHIRRVWLHDANIDYISGKHIPLFLVAMLVFFFLFLPYTLLLLFGQWLQAISHLRLFSWVNSTRLKPFIDSYHAPYKPKHRYWPGLLLVLRFVLLLVFGLNLQQDPNINLLAILLGAGALQLWAWVSGGVYKNWCLDALEGSFALNLTMLAAATYYVKLSAGNQLAVGYTSTFIALTTFLGILLYQITQQLRHTKLWKKMPILNFKFRKLNSKEAEDNQSNPISNSKEFDQLREPLLDDHPQPTHSVV